MRTASQPFLDVAHVLPGTGVRRDERRGKTKHRRHFPGAYHGVGNGRLLRKCPGGDATVLLSGLLFASGVAIGPDGAAYLTNKGTSATDGEVLRLPLTPCS